MSGIRRRNQRDEGYSYRRSVLRKSRKRSSIVTSTSGLGPRTHSATRCDELRTWQVLFWEMPDFNYDTQDGVPRSVAELRYARDILARELPPAIYSGLTAVLDDLERVNDEIAQYIDEGSLYQEREFGSKPCAG